MGGYAVRAPHRLEIALEQPLGISMQGHTPRLAPLPAPHRHGCPRQIEIPQLHIADFLDP